MIYQESTAKKRNLRNSKKRKAKEARQEVLEIANRPIIQKTIKYWDFEEGSSAKEHLEIFFIGANFLQLEDKQNEKLFPP